MRNIETVVLSIAKFLRCRKWIFIGWDSVVLVVGVCLLVLHCAFPAEGPIHFPISILRDSTHVSPTLAAEHNSALLSILSQRESEYRNRDSAYEDWKWQARMFYAAIVAGVLASILFTENRGKGAAKWILMYLIISMYLVEVHLEDLRFRSAIALKPTVEAADSILNRSHDDSTWFKLYYGKVDTLLAAADSSHRYREIANALCPNLFQWGFYVIPLSLSYLFVFTWHLRKKVDTSQDDITKHDNKSSKESNQTRY